MPNRYLPLVLLVCAAASAQQLAVTRTSYASTYSVQVTPDPDYYCPWDCATYSMPIGMVNRSGSVDVYFNPLEPPVATVQVPATQYYTQQFVLNRRWVDADDGWECAVRYLDTTGGQNIWRYIIFDDDNTTQLLAREGMFHGFAFDQPSTYSYAVVSNAADTSSTYEYYRWRSDLNVAPPAKARGAAPSVTMAHTAGPLVLHVDLAKNSKAHVRLMDMLGRTVFSGHHDLHRGSNTIAVPVNAFAQGSYLLGAQVGDAPFRHSVLSVDK